MTDRLRVGLIGAGQHGRYLSPFLREAGEVELVAAADPNEEARVQAVRECGYGKAYADYADLLAREALDAVLVAAPHHLLAPACLAALARGCHVFVEKPLGLNAAEGRQIVSAAEAAGRTLMVGYCLRFNQARLALKRLIAEGALGEITAVVCGKGSKPWPGWLQRPDLGGGQMMFLGSHLIDQVLWLVGRPAEQVYAEMTLAQTGVDETSAFTVRLAGGIRAEFLVSQAVGVGYDFVEILGQGGRARAEWPSMLLSVHSSLRPEYQFPTTIRVTGDSHKPMYVAELAEFVAAVRGGRAPAVDGRDAVRTLEIIDAVFASARAGHAVSLGQG
jgi:predicted dehydrogenase